MLCPWAASPSASGRSATPSPPRRREPRRCSWVAATVSPRSASWGIALARAGGRARLFYGGRSGADLPLLGRLRDQGLDVVPATEDGSVGTRGRVTVPLEAHLDATSGARRVYASGPDAMLHAVAGSRPPRAARAGEPRSVDGPRCGHLPRVRRRSRGPGGARRSTGRVYRGAGSTPPRSCGRGGLSPRGGACGRRSRDPRGRAGRAAPQEPLIAASGKFGDGVENEGVLDLSRAGGRVEGPLPAAREGGAPPRIAETPSGLLNSIGLQGSG